MNDRRITDENVLARLREVHNPEHAPTGDFTGRCEKCGSNDLWDDATTYGCNCCGAVFFTGDALPRLVCNYCGAEFPIGEVHACPVANKPIAFGR